LYEQAWKENVIVTFTTLYVGWPIAYANRGIENRSRAAPHNVGRAMRALYELRAISTMRQQTRQIKRTLWFLSQLKLSEEKGIRKNCSSTNIALRNYTRLERLLRNQNQAYAESQEKRTCSLCGS